MPRCLRCSPRRIGAMWIQRSLADGLVQPSTAYKAPETRIRKCLLPFGKNAEKHRVFHRE
jgi:hypothetical protein